MASGYQFITTSDGSPSLIGLESEAMHNKKGAFSETLYIYLEALKLHHKYQFPLNFLSVGLGLAYNELILTAFLIDQSRTPKRIISFESDPWLRENFLQWLKGEPCNGGAIWYQNYNEVLLLVSDHFKVAKTEIKQTLLQWFQDKTWILNGELKQETTFDEKFSCILFDAYSSHTTPELWSPDFFKQFFQKACHSQCVFTTYAAKGELFRQLRNHGFLIDKKEGYGGKRQSTLAIKTHIEEMPSRQQTQLLAEGTNPPTL